MNTNFDNTSFQGRSPLDAYLDDIGRLPRLTPDEEQELWKNPIGENRDKLAKGYLRLVVSIVSQILRKAPSNQEAFLDLVQAGNIGLLHAIDLFDCNKGVKFSTYSYNWILRYIREELCSHRCGVLGKSPWIVSDLTVVNKIDVLLTSILGRTPSDDELGVALDGIYSEDKIAEMLQLRHQLVLSLDMEYDSGGDEDNGSIGNYITDPNQASPEEAMEEALRATNLELMITKMKKILEPKLFLLMCARFGLGEFQDNELKLEDVAKLFYDRGLSTTIVTRERIRQLETKALQKLRKNPDFVNIFKNC